MGDDSERFVKAYSAYTATATSGEKQRLDALLKDAHQQSIEVLMGKRSRSEYPEGFDLAWSALHPEAQAPPQVEQHLLSLPIEQRVDGEGAILGFEKYERRDPGWLEAAAQWLWFRDHKAAFRNEPQIVKISENAKLIFAGDWGTGYWRSGKTGAERVGKLIAKEKADYTAHLGDVYYAGTKPEEAGHFIKLWPAGESGSFALNSNHEMYSGGWSYFADALGSSKFGLQKGTSYFALKNQNWIVVGLDTAYHSRDLLLMEGEIDAAQGGFLGRLGAQAGKRRIIVLTHHEGLSFTGDQCSKLWTQVVSALGRVPDYWYWGHAHNAIVYRLRDGCRCRCAGHGAIPYGDAPDLDGASAVEWYEKLNARDKSVPERVLNGYVRVTINGTSLTEEFVGENGSVRWTCDGLRVTH